MSETSAQSRFIRSAGLEMTEGELIYQHDYGEVAIPWSDITHAFCVIHKKKVLSTLPQFIVVVRDSPSFYYIDGNMISMRFLKGQGGLSADRSLLDMRKSKEDDLKRIIKEICSRFITTHIDRPLLAYLKGNQFSLPTFASQREIAEYMDRIISTADEEEGKGALLLEDEEDLNTIQSTQQERKEWAPGTIIEGNYTVQEVLHGGMGTVYIVFDSETIEFYAMKTFQESFLWNEAVIQQFINEAEIWVKLERHPHIVQASLVKMIEGKPYILLEYVQGSDLEHLLSMGPLTVEKSLDFAIQFSDGMSYAYKKLGLIHRDVKPANCLLTREGILKITDFGLGKIFDKPQHRGSGDLAQATAASTTSSSSSMVGTLPYMAPELFSEAHSSGVKTDIYAFGIVLYQMLTGVNPFYSEDPMEVISSHLSLEPESPREYNADTPEKLADLVFKCIAKDAASRYDNFDEIQRELEDIYDAFTGAPYVAYQVDDAFSEDDWFNKGVSLASLGRYREAVLTFDQALKHNPNSLRVIIQKGSALLDFGKLMDALACFEHGMTINAHDWKLWFYKAETHWKMGSTDEALECFNHALTLTDDRGALLGRRGILLSELGLYDDALECFDEALRENPRAAEVWDEKGFLLILANRYVEALECLNTSLEINPRSLTALYRHGLALFNLGLFSKAIASQKKALTLEPAHAPAWVNIGDSYREAGNSREALKAYRKAIELRPDQLEAYYSSISLMKENERWEDVIDTLDQAMEIDPENANLLLDRAEALLQLGSYDDASTYCQLILENDPGHEEAKILNHTISRWIEEQTTLFEEILREGPPEQNFDFNDFNTLICTFCNSRTALAHLVEKGGDTPLDLYFKSMLLYMEGNYHGSLQAAENVMHDATLADRAAKVKALAEERLGGAAARKKGFLEGLFKKGDMAKRTAEELFLMGIDKIHDRAYEEALDLFRASLEKKPDFQACLFYAARAYDLEGKSLKAHYHYDDFIIRFPRSIGFWKERLANKGISDPFVMRDVFHRWIRSYPRDYHSWFAYLTYLAENNYHEKIRLIASGVMKPSFHYWKSFENTPLHRLLIGFLKCYMGRNREAMEYFNQAMEDGHYLIPALIGLGKCYEGDDQADQALETYKKIKEMDFSSDESVIVMENTGEHFGKEEKQKEIAAMACYCIALAELKRENPEAALAAVEEGLESLNDSLIMLNKKAQMYIAMKRYGEFFDFYNQVYSMDNTFIPIKALRGNALVETGKVNDAVNELNNILALDSINLVVLKNLGFIFLATQNYPKSLSFFDKILSVYSLNYEVHLGKGITSYLMKEYEVARQCFLTALELYPTDADLWQFLGAVYFHLGELNASGKCWEKALRYRSRFVQGWTNRGTFLYYHGDYQRAQECADRALRLDGEYSPAWLVRAQCQWKTGHFQEALKSVERALTFSPLLVRGWCLQGILEFDMGTLESSLQSFDKATQIDNKVGMLWYNRAIVALHLKNQSEARRSIDRANALLGDYFETFIARFAFEKEANPALNEDLYLTPARNADPERFAQWQQEYHATGNPLSLLDLQDMADDPFTLPITRPLAVVEPVTLFHYRMEKPIL